MNQIPLRPDEIAAESEIERSRKMDKTLKKGAKIALASSVAPFLSSYIPTDLAVKGISKLSTKLGDFLKAGISAGLDPKEGLNYIKNQIDTEESSKANMERNIIQQYSPELFEFINSEIQKGRSPLEAGALAQVNSKFKNIIKKMTDDHKTPFSSILQTVFGQGVQQGQSGQPQQGGGSDDQLISALQNILQM
jgi:hypothetical protein